MRWRVIRVGAVVVLSLVVFVGLVSSVRAQETTYQQSDPKITYLGDWTTYADPGASGGSFVLTGEIGAAAVVSFTGTEVALIAKTGPTRGKAQVTLKDGSGAVVHEEIVDLYWPTYRQQHRVYEQTGLADAPHTLTITNLLEKNPASSHYRTTLDAVEILGTLTASSNRYEQDHGDLGYSGN